MYIGSGVGVVAQAPGLLFGHGQSGPSAEYINYATLYATPSDIGTVWTGGSGTGGAVVNSTELAAALTALKDTGGTIVVDSTATISAYTITTAPTATVMIRGASSAAKAKLPTTSWVATSSPSGGIVFKWCDFGDAAASTGNCFSIGDGTTKTYGTLKFFECEFYGTALGAYTDYSAGCTSSRAGINVTGTTTIGTFELNGSYLHDLENGGSRYNASVSAVVFNNTYDLIYSDFSGWTRPASSAGVPIKFYFNKMSRGLRLKTDTGALHPDYFQVFANSINQNWEDCEIIGNIIFGAESRGNSQGIFSGDMQPYYINNARIVGNVVLTDTSKGTSTNHLVIEQASNCFMFGNVSLEAKPTTNTSGASSARLGSELSTGRNYYGYNTVGIVTPTLGSAVKSNNTTLTTTPSLLANYQGKFAWASDPTNITEVISAIEYNPGEYLFGYVDYINCKLKVSIEPAFLPLNVVLDATASSTATSNWVKLISGKSSNTISVSAGGEYRIADDSAGTGASAWTSASGTVYRGKWVQVRHTTSAGNGVTTTTAVTVGSTVNNFYTVNADSVTLSKATLSGTEYSKSAGAWSSSAYPCWVMAFRFKSTSATANQVVFGSNTGVSKLTVSPASSKGTLQLIGSTTVKFDVPAASTGNESILLVSIDFTQNNGTEAEDYAAGVKVVLNNVQQALGTLSYFATTSGTRTATLGNFSASGIGFGDYAAGTSTNFVGDITYIWMHGFSTPADMIDISDPTVFSKFSPSNIGSDGSGPLGGTQPLVYYNGDATAWNDAGGLLNIGSATTNEAMVRQAGTYT